MNSAEQWVFIEVFQVRRPIDVGEVRSGADLVSRITYSFYWVLRPSGVPARDSVRSVPAEEVRWRAAGERFERAAKAAEDAYWSATRRWRVRFLPGARRRREQSVERLRAALAQAEEDYAPVREEINRRLTAEAEEREEQDRRREAEQAERRARQALWRDRCHELASRRVWCWVVEGGGTSVLIHRCDLPAAAQARGTVHRPAKPLTFHQLEKKLLKLGDEGCTTVRWDQACRDSVVAECSVPGGAESFEEWWAVVTSDFWLRPDTMPRRPPSGPVRGRGGHGYTATDYGSGGFNCGGGF